MSYEMTSLLEKCTAADFDLLIGIIKTNVGFTNDTELKALNDAYKATGDLAKAPLTMAIEKDIRYLGSSDAAFAYRKIIDKAAVPGVSAHEIVRDVSRTLKVKQVLVGSLESKIERITKFAVERTFHKLTPEEQRELFEKAGIGREQQQEFFDKVKSNKMHLAPLLLSVFGAPIARTLIEALAVALLTKLVGKKVAEELIKAFLTRFPLVAEFLGPVVWALSLGWLAYDLQGPAMRKTVPIVIFLGIVALRDGPEDPTSFWSDDSSE